MFNADVRGGCSMAPACDTGSRTPNMALRGEPESGLFRAAPVADL